MSAAAPRRFYIAPHPDADSARILLARQRPYSRLEDAFADMESGVVFDDSGEIVAFHQRHQRLLELRARRAPLSAAAMPRMSNTPAAVAS